VNPPVVPREKSGLQVAYIFLAVLVQQVVVVSSRLDTEGGRSIGQEQHLKKTGVKKKSQWCRLKFLSAS